MLLSATLSKPVKNISEKSGDEYQRIKLKLSSASSQEILYFAEFYTEKQVFHKKLSEKEALSFLEENAGKTFKNCVQRTETEEITILASKKGKITRLTKKLSGTNGSKESASPLKTL